MRYLRAVMTFEASDNGLLPYAFIARTLKVYVPPEIRPETVAAVVVAPVTVTDLAADVAPLR